MASERKEYHLEQLLRMGCQLSRLEGAPCLSSSSISHHKPRFKTLEWFCPSTCGCRKGGFQGLTTLTDVISSRQAVLDAQNLKDFIAMRLLNAWSIWVCLDSSSIHLNSVVSAALLRSTTAAVWVPPQFECQPSPLAS